MLESTLTAKGQTTVPQPIRDALHAMSGMKLQWHQVMDGTIVVRAKNQSLLDMAGMLHAPKQKKVSVDAMNAWR
jgi:antitoxin PrlF